MVRTLQRLSAAVFFLLGASFFVAYVLLRNGVYMNECAVWMQVADLPLAFCAVIYGGTSLYLGLRDPKQSSRTLAWGIAIPLLLIFALILVMNFWPA
jgi:hypothetical protein